MFLKDIEIGNKGLWEPTDVKIHLLGLDIHKRKKTSNNIDRLHVNYIYSNNNPIILDIIIIVRE